MAWFKSSSIETWANNRTLTVASGVMLGSLVFRIWARWPMSDDSWQSFVFDSTLGFTLSELSWRYTLWRAFKRGELMEKPSS